MKRILELSMQHVQGLITAREYRSRLVAQLSMLHDEDTLELADAITLGMEH